MTSSVRDRSKRLNQGVFISGASGSGKSRMTARLAEYWDRKIFVDPMGSFDAEYTARTFKQAVDYLAPRWSGDAEFSLAIQFDNDEDYRRFFAALYALMQKTRGGINNFLLVLDEIDLWSGPKYLDESLSKILRYGRHYGCSWIANCRADVHTNRDVRMNAACILLFRQGMLSPEMANSVKAAANEREEIFPSVAKLKRHGPDQPDLAIEGEHFIAVPEPFSDWLPTWEALAEQ
jgi:hypothetical protein